MGARPDRPSARGAHLGDPLRHPRRGAGQRGWSRRRSPSPEIAWAWRQLAQSDGRIAIASLTDELGWSPKRLIARFRAQIGLPPKQAARLLRFQRASEDLAPAAASDWCAFAQDYGFYDQAHLINEFRRFAGDTPDGLLRRRLPMGGFAAD